MTDEELDKQIDEAERHYARIAREGSLEDVASALADFALHGKDTDGMFPSDQTAMKLARRARRLRPK